MIKGTTLVLAVEITPTGNYVPNCSHAGIKLFRLNIHSDALAVDRHHQGHPSALHPSCSYRTDKTPHTLY